MKYICGSCFMCEKKLGSKVVNLISPFKTKTPPKSEGLHVFK